jgi:hypothetical protein
MDNSFTILRRKCLNVGKESLHLNKVSWIRFGYYNPSTKNLRHRLRRSGIGAKIVIVCWERNGQQTIYFCTNQTEHIIKETAEIIRLTSNDKLLLRENLFETPPRIIQRFAEIDQSNLAMLRPLRKGDKTIAWTLTKSQHAWTSDDLNPSRRTGQIQSKAVSVSLLPFWSDPYVNLSVPRTLLRQIVDAAWSGASGIHLKSAQNFAEEDALEASV